MAKKEYVDRAATIEDFDYKIEVTALAPMKEMDKEYNLKETGKKEKGKEYQGKEISSDMLQEGIIIAAEDSKEKQDIQH